MNIDLIINKIVDTISTKTVIGEPMEIGELTLIPVVNVAFGFGAGSGDDPKAGGGTGGGGGARLKVAGMIVVKGDDISFMPTGKGGAFDKLIDSIPDLMDKVKIQVDKGQKEKEATE